MHSYRSLPLCVAAAALVCGSGAVFAAADPAVAPPSITDSVMAWPQPQATIHLPGPAQASPAVESASILEGSRPIDIERLAAMRGGETTIEGNTSVDGSVHDNTADHVVSGSNFVSDDAFSNASGLNTVIQNSGSNVLIQNGMSVQVIFANPGQ
jgi:hypothetical protein